VLLPEHFRYRSEWITHQHRDTYASIVGHPPLLGFVSIADGESIGRTKFEMAEVSQAPLDNAKSPN
jgi:splicing factor 3B subunit 5